MNPMIDGYLNGSVNAERTLRQMLTSFKRNHPDARYLNLDDYVIEFFDMDKDDNPIPREDWVSFIPVNSEGEEDRDNAFFFGLGSPDLSDEVIELCKNWAMDSVFYDRPYFKDDWDTVMSYDWDDTTEYPDEFMLSEQYQGYSTSYIHDILETEFSTYQTFARKIKDLS